VFQGEGLKSGKYICLRARSLILICGQVEEIYPVTEKAKLCQDSRS